MTLVIGLVAVSGCSGEEASGPVLAGGREVKSWIADLHDPKPHVRRTAVLKLGNVGDSDPAAAEGLAEALRDSDAIVRRDAVSAVAKLSKPSAETMAWLRVMVDKDADSRVRDYAKRALAYFARRK
jgi:HEAT repeat protein